MTDQELIDLFRKARLIPCQNINIHRTDFYIGDNDYISTTQTSGVVKIRLIPINKFRNVQTNTW